MKMKTLTVNGQTFSVTDGEAVHYDEKQDLTQNEKKQARQNIGAASVPVVRAGQSVSFGQCIADAPGEGYLGLPVHSPVDGKVLSVTDEVITIESAERN